MPSVSKTFRVFVSSTFSDLEAERNALQEMVFPRLRELAAVHGGRFQAIDLRWGVSDEASLDQQTMNICLDEIARCQKISPRLNFIVLLGDRYGWCPPPPQIPDAEFKQILETVTSEEKAFIKEWYLPDKNAGSPEWRLKPRAQGGGYENYDNWQPVESQLHAALSRAAKKLAFAEDKRLPYIASATEQEIHAGVLRVKETPEHVLCFFRSVDGLPQQFNPHDFLAIVHARLKDEYPDGLSQSSQELVNTILEMDTVLSAKVLAERIKKALKETPEATAEEDTLKFIHKILVDYTAKDFMNLDEEEWTIDEEARRKQSELKKQLREYIPDHIHSYHANWTGDGITTNHIGTLPNKLEHCMPLLDEDYSPTTLCKAIWCSLGGILLEEIEPPHEAAQTEEVEIQIQPDEALDAEGQAQHKFAEEHLRFFVGRTEILVKIADYLKDTGGRSLAIVGEGGTGKSTLMAKAIQQTQESHPKAQIVYRFISTIPGSSDGRSLLDSLCREISRRYGADEADIPTDYQDLVPELGKRMQLASADQPLILFLDSLDQLSSNQNARSLIWLPNELPEGVFVMVSTRKENTYTALQAKQIHEEELGGLSRREGSKLLSQWLRSVNRWLQPAQRREVLDKFVESKGNPLYLQLAFEEARLWTAESKRATAPEKLEPGVSGIIKKNMIERLTKESNHGETLVSHALGYLAASRHGLAEDELVDLLSRDLQVYRWFLEGSHHLPADLIQWAVEYRRSHSDQPHKKDGRSHLDEERAALEWLKEIRTPPEKLVDFLREVLPKTNGPRLPIVLWSRLSFDLAPYLSERMVDGSSLMTFYHRELGDVSKKIYLDGDQGQPYHARLADYFRFKADLTGDHTWNGAYPHGLSELPYHLTEAGQYDEVYQILTDFQFLEHKAAEVGVTEQNDGTKFYGGVLQLQDDYDQVLNKMPGGDGAAGGGRPLIVTAVDLGGGLVVRCPWCNRQHPLTAARRKKWLGKVIRCPNKDCEKPLKVNPFVVERRGGHGM